jgi:CRP/FNR family transcriptional regulator
VDAGHHPGRNSSRRAHAAATTGWEGFLLQAGRHAPAPAGVNGADGVNGANGANEANGLDPAASIAGKRIVRRGQALYRANDTFANLYIVTAGSLKTVMFHSEGREQISDFPLAGDLLGLDGLGSGRHTCDAIALEDSQLCVIPFLLLEQRCRDHASVQHRLHRLMGAEIVREQKFFMLLARMCADERLADFLTNMSRKLSACGYSAHEFNLRMTREDIGNHLGLKLETVSRTFSRFQANGYVGVQQKHITILDYPALHRIAIGKPDAHPAA